MQTPNNTATPNEPTSGPPDEQPKGKPTPRKSGTPRSTGDVTGHRSQIVNQMKHEMVHCPGWDEKGFDHYLPFKPTEVDIEAAVTALTMKKHLKSVDGHLEFTKSPVTPSKVGTANEKTRYQPLVDIARVLEDLTLTNGRKASCRFLQRPDNFNAAETQGANFKVDAFLELIQSTMPPSSMQSSSAVADLAVPSEYKTARKHVRQNRKQLLGTAAFCMNDDPRRKHIYGITIEDDTMAVWYFSRSHSAKSPDFNFTVDYKIYIRVMLSLMFATEEELGYDPTIQRRLDPEANKLCFVYKVNDHYYKTQKAIFDHRSLCITGRATRVWEVIRVESFDDLQQVEGSRTMVLKDVWLDDGSMTEGEIQREIFADLKKIADAFKAGKEPEGFAGMDDDSKKMLRECLQKENWGRYFLTIFHESRGSTSKDVAETAEPDPTLFDESSSANEPKPASVPGVDPTRNNLANPTDLVTRSEKLVYRRYRPKQQSRIIFEEVCVALHDVPKLGDVLTAMTSCVFALQLMFLAGWVHRDISSGNLYWFKDNDGEARGILGDLEYAKRFRPFDGKGSADPKTGTAYFMAVEIQKETLLYSPQASLQGSLQAFYMGIGNPDSPSVVHNFEHDMESIFWLLLWTILVRFPLSRGPHEWSAYKSTMSGIFQDTSVCSNERERVFTHAGTLRELLTRFLAPRLQSLQEVLDGLRGVLQAGYLARQHNFDDLSSYSPLYQVLLDTLRRCQELTKDLSLAELRPCRKSNATQAETVNLPLQVNKRRRSHDNERGQFSKTARGQETTDAAAARTVLESNPVSDDEGDRDPSQSV